MKNIITVSILLLTVDFSQAYYKTGDVRLSPQLLNYQGYLTDTLGNPVTNPSISMAFTIFDNNAYGNQKWTETQASVSVDKGIFHVLLGSITPIPDSVFVTRGDRWLELAVAGQVLTPRTQIVSVGYAYTATYSDTAEYARNAATDNDWIRSGGKVYTSYTTDSVGIGTIAPRYALDVNGVICGGISDLANGIASFIGGGYSNVAGDSVIDSASTVSGGWNNSATEKYAYIGGGKNNVAGGFRTTVGGGYNNIAYKDATTIAGGYSNLADSSFATVGGGYDNAVSGYSTVISGGCYNTISENYGTIGGGVRDTVKAPYGAVLGGYSNLAGDQTADTAAVVAGGFNNSVQDKFTVVGGGRDNSAIGDYSVVAGGRRNFTYDYGITISGGMKNTSNTFCSTIAGGDSNTTTGQYATVGGGRHNFSNGNNATIGGGNQNIANGVSVNIGGGQSNITDDDLATVGGGLNNTAGNYASTVAGGRDNIASGQYAIVGGGYLDTASGDYATVGGGCNNTAIGNYTTVAGGYNNTASAVYTTVGGGNNNTASANYATVVGGGFNTASGLSSAIVGSSNTVEADYGFAANSNSSVLSGHTSATAFNGLTTTAAGQTRVGNLSKVSGTFTIDHPLDPEHKILNHYFVESPEMVLIYRGSAVIGEAGRAVVHLPDYFDALNENPMIQLTGVGSSEVVYVADEVKGNQFAIGGKPGVKVYWTVTGARKDPSAEITKILVPVEQVKEGGLDGRSLDDEYLVVTKGQLERMGKADGFKFRHALEEQRYGEMKRMIEESNSK